MAREHVRMKKLLYLFLALLLPGLIFIFLKHFGKNQFDIPVYYKEGVSISPAGCSQGYPIPYLVPDSLLRDLGWTGSAVTLLISHPDEIRNSLARLSDQFEEREYALIGLDSASEETRSCVLLLQDSFRVVMVDDQRRVRGYYNPRTREETDRLILEMSIMMKKY